MIIKWKPLSTLIRIFCFGICTFHVGIVNSQSLNDSSLEKESGFSIYLTVLLAMFLTFITVIAIGLLARYLKETTGSYFNSFEDSDH